MSYVGSQAAWVSVTMILGMQLFVIAFTAEFTQFTINNAFASAIVWGGLAQIIPNMVFAMRLFKRRVYAPQRFLQRFYGAEVIKIALTVLLLAALLSIFPAYAVAVLVGYVLTHLGTWLALPLLKK